MPIDPPSRQPQRAEQVALDAVDVRPVRHDQKRLVVETRQIALEQQRDLARVRRPRDEAQSHRAIEPRSSRQSHRAMRSPGRRRIRRGASAARTCRLRAEFPGSTAARSRDLIGAPQPRCGATGHGRRLHRPAAPSGGRAATSADGRGAQQRGPASSPAQSSQRSATFDPRRASVNVTRIAAPLFSPTSCPQLSHTRTVLRAKESSPSTQVIADVAIVVKNVERKHCADKSAATFIRVMTSDENSGLRVFEQSLLPDPEPDDSRSRARRRRRLPPIRPYLLIASAAASPNL